MAAGISGGRCRNIHPHCSRVHLLIHFSPFGDVFLWAQSPERCLQLSFILTFCRFISVKSLWVFFLPFCVFLFACQIAVAAASQLAVAAASQLAVAAASSVSPAPAQRRLLKPSPASGHSNPISTSLRSEPANHRGLI